MVKEIVSPDDRFGEEVWFDLTGVHLVNSTTDVGTLTPGKITHAFLNGSNIKYYHIRNSDGYYFQRHNGEFSTRKK